MDTLVTRRNRQTKTLVTVGRAEDLDLDADLGNLAWYSVCDDHGQAVGHTSRKRAISWAAEPAQWCSECGELVGRSHEWKPAG